MRLIADEEFVVRVVQDCEMTIHSSEEDEEGVGKIFRVGDILEFFVVDHPEIGGQESVAHANIQFPDGSMAFGVSGEWFEERGL